MTKFHDDILRQPRQFRSLLAYHRAGGFHELEAAAALIRDATHLIIVGMGASHNAGWAVLHAFNRHGRFATLVDASEFEALSFLPPSSAVLFLSRSGRSIELVRGIERCARQGLATVAITNDRESPVARTAGAHVFLSIAFDHAVSVATYSAIVLLGGLLAVAVEQASSLPAAVADIEAGCETVDARVASWQHAVDGLDPEFARRPTYFLGRAESLGSAHAGMLLWEEVGKTPAAALTTGAFRHGPQEVLRLPVNVIAWLSDAFARENDEALLREIGAAGSHVYVIATRAPQPAAGLCFEVPPVSPDFQAAFNAVPVQLLAARLAALNGVDSDGFRFAQYIVQTDRGLT